MMVALVAIILFAACSDSSSSLDPVIEGGELGLTYEMPTIESYGRYYTVNLSSDDLNDGTIEVTSDSEWLTVTSDTLAEDGILEFRTTDNEEIKGRNGYLTLTSAKTRRSQVIEVYQRGEGDYDTNDSGDIMEDFGVGWGYNAFLEYQSRNSICNKVLDANQLSYLDTDSTFQSIQEVIRSSEEFEIISAYSMQEMSSQLTKKMESTSSFLGVKKTVHRMQEVCSSSLSENYMAYARLYKVVASKSVDHGALDYLVSTVSPEKLPFTEAFKELYLKILKASASARPALIKNMINTYGTHLIVEGLAGGSIDYVATFSSKYVSEFEKNAEYQCSKVFGKSSNSSYSNLESSVTSDITNDNSFTIMGGSSDSRTALKKSFKGLKTQESLSNTELQNWLSSIYYSTSNKKNLDIVDFSFMPIWDLFTDVTIRSDIMTQVLEIASQSNNAYTEQELGLDNYIVNITGSNFDFDSSGSLVKVLYRKNGSSEKVPIMEICSEYVPKIRTDRRVTIFYPIKNGRTQHSQGLFPGDGEGNRPAFLSFYEGSCFVNPIDGYGYYDKITEVYLMHGNLYEQDYQVTCTDVTNSSVVTAQQLQFDSSNNKYDIVKIGSGYWTRTNIKESMGFGVYKGRTFTLRETLYNNMLYAYILNQRSTFINSQPDVYGPARDSETDLALYWYLPANQDKEFLTEYIGNNTKPLFKNGVTGFDAQFCGYFSSGDTKPSSTDSCFIAFKETSGSSEKGYALVLSKNYDWTTKEITTINRRFPIRLYRSRYFTYSNLK